MRKSLGALSLITLGVISMLTYSPVMAQKKVCKALAMSGGANKGAYEVGVLHGLAHLLDPKEIAWDVVTGVSAGAINAGAMSLWDPMDSKAMSEWLEETFLKMTSDQVYTTWPMGYVQGLFYKSGVYDNTPLFNFIQNVLKSFGSIKRKVAVSAVDVNTGEYVTYTEKDTPFDKMTEKIVASASIPFIFPNAKVSDPKIPGGRIMMDGGTVWNTNMISAIDRCMEVVDNEEDIIMDIIICGTDKITATTKTGNTIDNYMRYWSVKNYNKGMSDIYEFKRAHPKIQYRYFFQSSGPLTWGFDEMKFEPAIIIPMINYGKLDAKTEVERRKGQSWKRLEEWYENSEIREKHEKLTDFIHSE